MRRRRGAPPIGPAHGGDGCLHSYLSWAADTPESGILGHCADDDSFQPEPGDIVNCDANEVLG